MARPRIHSVDDAFFDTIDSEAKAYWLGFLYADGHPAARAVMLGLAVKDGGHVYKFREAVNSTHAIRERTHSVSVSVCSTRLAERLSMLRSDAHIPSSHTNHFVRGVFDGDGCIHITKGVLHPGVTIAGRKVLLTKIATLCRRHGIDGGYLRKHDRPSTKTWVLHIGTVSGVCAFKEWVYRDATICLKRKRDIIEGVQRIPARTCEVCGKEFQPRYRAKGRYCSSECYHYIYYRENK